MKTAGWTVERLRSLVWFLALGGVGIHAVNLAFCWSRFKRGAWSQLNWHGSADNLAPYYRNGFYFYLLVCLLLLLFGARIKILCAEAVDWLARPSHRAPRALIFWTFIFFAASHALKLHWGFWFPSIGGWTYAKAGSRLSPEPPVLGGKEGPASNYPFLEKALNRENLGFVPGKGWLSGEAVFLHFSGGEILPASWELSGLIFPRYVLPRLPATGSLGIFRRVLDQRRSRRRFFLPDSVAYPPHTPYMPLDYGAYPPASELRRVTDWELSAFLDGLGGVSIVSASLHGDWRD